MRLATLLLTLDLLVFGLGGVQCNETDPTLLVNASNSTLAETSAGFVPVTTILATPSPGQLTQAQSTAKAPPKDTTYYSLIRLNIEGDIPAGTSLQDYLKKQIELYVATYGAEVSSLVIDYVTQILTNHVDPGSGLSGNHRRLMQAIGNGTDLPPNTTAVIVALQSQSWTNMQAVTAGVNAQNLARSSNGRKVLQVSAVSSTVSYPSGPL
ncbi:hypothetical protein GUITHDRAFT_117709 [Guillardia theta CCMP2712]|uniref:Uncharacterized protein n=1 Tax=Guillardia theta (strain CCMP2712) TaxID=905079 RepID=L1IJ95_GUITC|nr:hypothetical protein GUITHDRAFT_117709 [Guillardia theta CCMP2712]EKX36187.1 hypothetical protein GUITHDRAFT_117709 [Guillardia theta CCMP2712]|eukprot:XP_005823167.1 hypothetical protein GUITHDRAFT_117709 [Guillardia theta CCMP2712]